MIKKIVFRMMVKYLVNVELTTAKGTIILCCNHEKKNMNVLNQKSVNQGSSAESLTVRATELAACNASST